MLTRKGPPMLSRVLRRFFGFEARLNQRERLPRRVIPRLEL
jgi:hypothetical protein